MILKKLILKKIDSETIFHTLRNIGEIAYMTYGGLYERK